MPLFFRLCEYQPFATLTSRDQYGKCPNVLRNNITFHNFISILSIFIEFLENNILSGTPCRRGWRGIILLGECSIRRTFSAYTAEFETDKNTGGSSPEIWSGTGPLWKSAVGPFQTQFFPCNAAAAALWHTTAAVCYYSKYYAYLPFEFLGNPIVAFLFSSPCSL